MCMIKLQFEFRWCDLKKYWSLMEEREMTLGLKEEETEETNKFTAKIIGNEKWKILGPFKRFESNSIRIYFNFNTILDHKPLHLEQWSANCVSRGFLRCVVKNF